MKTMDGKTIRACVLGMSLLGLTARGGAAELIADDNFSGPRDTLEGRNGGQGWSDPWTVAGGYATNGYAMIVDKAMKATGGPSCKQALRIQMPLEKQGSLSRIARTFPSQQAGQVRDIYVSFLFESPTTQPGEDDFLFLWLGNETTDVANNAPEGSFIGIYNRPYNVDDGSLMNLRGSGAPDTQTPGEAMTPPDTTAFVVLKISASRGGDDAVYDRAELFFNPASSREPSSPTLSIALEPGDAPRSLDRVGIQTNLMEKGDTYFIGSLRIGKDWASVTGPMP